MYKSKDVIESYRALENSKVVITKTQNGYSPSLKVEITNKESRKLLKEVFKYRFDDDAYYIKDNKKENATYPHEEIAKTIAKQEYYRVLKLFKFKQFMITNIELDEAIDSNTTFLVSVRR